MIYLIEDRDFFKNKFGNIKNFYYARVIYYIYYIYYYILLIFQPIRSVDKVFRYTRVRDPRKIIENQYFTS